MQTPTNPSLRNQTIENYIQRVTELSQLGQKIPTDEELNKIVTELGITEAEIASAKKQSEDHFTRARGYCDLRHWDEAIAELQEAVSFNPLNLDMLHLLASSHLGRWHEKHQKQDIQQLQMRVKQCLEIQPSHEESLNLLAKLDRAIRQRQYQHIAIASLLSIITGSILGYFWLNNLSFNPFSKRNVELENLRTELNQEIIKLKEEQQFLLNKIAQEEQENQTEIDQVNNQVRNLQTHIQNLNQQNELLKEQLAKLSQQYRNENSNIINLPKQP